jgi:hypothetical protein
MDCCLYPWPDPDGIPLYPPEDLPETLRVASDGPVSFTLTKTSGYRYEGVRPGNDFDDPQPVYIKRSDDGHWWYGEIVEGEDDPYIWRSNCLIGSGWSGIVIEDQFPDTLTFGDPGIPETCELLRVSLCRWEGLWEYPYSDGSGLRRIAVDLRYDPTYYDPGWHPKPMWRIDLLAVDMDATVLKDDPQSGPEGNYEYYIVSS